MSMPQLQMMSEYNNFVRECHIFIINARCPWPLQTLEFWSVEQRKLTMVLAGVLGNSYYYDEEEQDNSTKCLDNEFPYSDFLSNAAAIV